VGGYLTYQTLALNGKRRGSSKSAYDQRRGRQFVALAVCFRIWNHARIPLCKRSGSRVQDILAAVTPYAVGHSDKAVSDYLLEVLQRLGK
jgi:hypothetical protein